VRRWIVRPLHDPSVSVEPMFARAKRCHEQHAVLFCPTPQGRTKSNSSLTLNILLAEWVTFGQPASIARHTLEA
jgi:hypothetical protein